MCYRATPLVAGALLLSAQAPHRISGPTRRQAGARARRDLDRLPKKCAVTVTQDASRVLVPVAGATCRGTVGDPGDLVDPDVLRACLLPALEPETRDAAPRAACATAAR